MSDNIPWWKMGIIFAILVIVPVWVFNVGAATLGWKIMFTIAGAAGIYLYFYAGLHLRKRK